MIGILALAMPAHGTGMKYKAGGGNHGHGVKVSDKNGVTAFRATALNKIYTAESGMEIGRAYCLNPGVSVEMKAFYQESDWMNSGIKIPENLGKIQWILNNSYPNKSIEELKNAASAFHDIGLNDAITATQAAIWYFSDELDLEKVEVSAKVEAQQKAVEARTIALYKWLLIQASENDIDENKSSFSITFPTTNFFTNNKIEPIIFNSNNTGSAIGIKLDRDDVTLKYVASDEEVDLNDVKTGMPIYFISPNKAGEVNFTFSSPNKTPMGRIFKKHVDSIIGTQTLVLATDSPEYTKSATLAWTDKPVVPSPIPTPIPAPEIALPITSSNFTIKFLAVIVSVAVAVSIAKFSKQKFSKNI